MVNQVINLANEINNLNYSLSQTANEIKILQDKIPKGAKLRVTKHGNGFQYFLRKGNDTNGKYIKKKDRNTAELLAQLEYDEKLIEALKDVLASVNSCKEIMACNPYETALNQMPPGKRELVKTPYISDESFIINWKQQEYDGLGFKDGMPEFYTRKGLRVRSKSEVIIADILDEMYIPFLYEKPLKLNSGTIHPDFTLLNIAERKEVYWEHFGMMDDVEYRYNAFLKIRDYEANGLFQFVSLIWTIETGRNPINTRDLRKMVASLQKKLGY